LERVQDEPLAGERGLGLLGDLGRERGAVADDLLDGQPADDRTEATGEDLLGECLDFVLLL
jgi:hypothetical protein